jgi:alpha-1,2-mannosyltransferase
MTSASVPVALARPDRSAWRPPGWWPRRAFWLLGSVALVVYLAPGLLAPAAHWPLWDVRVYAWGGQQADQGGALYTPGSPFSFTYPPFAAWLFEDVPIGVLEGVLFLGSVVALAVLTGQALSAAGIRHRPDIVFGVSALALLSEPVAYTLHLGEVNLILASLVGSDLLRRQDGSRWQGAATGLAAGIKLTPLVFVVYLLITGRIRAAVTAAATFAVTIVVGYLVLPAQSGMFWLGGVFADSHRIGDQANPSDQSLAGALARLAGNTVAPRGWWLAAAAVTALSGLAVAAWAHRRGHRLGGVVSCAITGLLISPISWTHHWVWAVPLVVWLGVAAWRCRPWLAGLSVAAVASIFSPIPLPWTGGSPGPGRLLAGDLYVLCGLAILAGTAVALFLTRRASGRSGEQQPGRIRPGDAEDLTLAARQDGGRPGQPSSITRSGAGR